LSPAFLKGLDDPAIHGLEDGAVFADAKDKGTVQALDEYLAWYPEGEHVDEAKSLDDDAVFTASRKAAPELGSLAWGHYLTRYPGGTHKGEALLALGQQVNLVIADEEQQLARDEAERRRQEEVAAREKAEKEKRATKLNPLLDAILSEDSQSWALNRYVQGSASDTDILSKSAEDHTITIRGNFKVNAGTDGWLEATLNRAGDVLCLRYWDFPNQCKKMGELNPILQGIARASAQRQASGGGSNCMINLPEAAFYSEMGAPSFVVGAAAAEPCH
jgi:hypothetical protein